MDEYADEETSARRKNELMEIQYEISLKNNQRFVGQTVKVIIDEVYEGEDGGTYCIGRTEGDAHEVDNQVRFHTILVLETSICQCQH